MGGFHSRGEGLEWQILLQLHFLLPHISDWDGADFGAKTSGIVTISMVPVLGCLQEHIPVPAAHWHKAEELQIIQGEEKALHEGTSSKDFPKRVMKPAWSEHICSCSGQGG